LKNCATHINFNSLKIEVVKWFAKWLFLSSSMLIVRGSLLVFVSLCHSVTKRGRTGSCRALCLNFHICLVIYNVSAILKFNSYDFLLCFTCSGEIDIAGWCLKSGFIELGQD
jgi:hypothetical protein